MVNYHIIKYKILRFENEKKQGEIANILNVKRNTYSKWENLINDIPIDKYNELANYYHVSLNYILGLSETSEKNFNSFFINWSLL